MTKRVRDGSITLDDYDAQSLEVARQVGTVLCMVRIDHLFTTEDYDKFVRSFKDNDLGMCDGCSVWTIDCGKFDDPDNDRGMRKHIGRNPKITKSILESGNFHVLHSRVYDGMHWFFSSTKSWS